MLAKKLAALVLAAASPVDLPMEFDLEDDKGDRATVSVVIPSYDRAYIVGDAIQSALDQSYANIEVIVVDDGSRDDTEAVVRRFDDRVRYVRQENAGVCAARNRGLQESRGEFVALLDSDDKWLPWKLESQIAVLRQYPDVGMVWSDMVAVDESGRWLDPAYLRHFYVAHSRVRIESALLDEGALGFLWDDAPAAVADRHVYRGDLFSPMILGNLVHTSTIVLRRSRLAAIGGFDTRLRRSGEDYEFHLRTCALGPVAFVDASSVLYRVGAEDQLTSPRYGVDMARNNLETVYRWMASGANRIDLDECLLAERLAESHAWLGEKEFLAGQVSSARRHLRESLSIAPWTGRRLAMYMSTFMPRTWFEVANRARKKGVGRWRRLTNQ